MIILGIETSCDETAASLVEDGTKILSNVVASSQELHIKTGGIIPEVAAREQVKGIIPVIKEAINQSSVFSCQLSEKSQSVNRSTGQRISENRKRKTDNHISDIDALAVTVGPGLIGSLLVGVETAKTLAYVWKKPIVPVNHLLAHVYANWLNPSKTVEQLSSKAVIGKTVKKNVVLTDYCSPDLLSYRSTELPRFPAIALIVSGGHTELILMKNHGQHTCLGGTRDDAAGECFDKCARLLGLGYPGGPAISAAAEKPTTHNPQPTTCLPRPMIDSDDFDFSFSGLKTAVIRELKKLGLIPHHSNDLYHPTSLVNSFAYEVQEAITDVLVEKTIRAAKKYKVKSILLSGGVAANDCLRQKFQSAIEQLNNETIRLFIPSPPLCTDNAAMVASCAYFNFKPFPWQEIQALPSLEI